MVTKRLVSSVGNIFKAKIHFFLKKSIWTYLIMSVVLGFLLPLGEFSSIITAVVYFAGIMAVLWPLQYLSAKAFAKQLDFDAMVAFDEDTITINHNNKDLVETKDWTWVKDIELGKDTIWLTINQPRPFAISIPRSELTEADYVFFEGKKQML